MDDSRHQAAKRPKAFVTTSWDDGHPNDLRLAKMLKSRGMKATFYVPFRGPGDRPTIGASEINELASQGFEIGGHTLSHCSLTPLPIPEIAHEVRGSKDKLEGILQKPVRMFCYPNGRYDRRVIHEVMRAGYEGARTTKLLSTSASLSPFEMPTTTQLFRHKTSNYLRNVVRNRNFGGLWTYADLIGRGDWLAIAKTSFDRVLREGGVWHIFGHSWELEEYGLWKDLEDLLDLVHGHADITYVDNYQLLAATLHNSNPCSVRSPGSECELPEGDRLTGN